LFNSYYQSVGPMHERARRGLLSRPTWQEVLDFRRRVDDGVREWLAVREDDAELAMLVTLGLNHEQQHQELLLTDLKHLFSMNPLEPVYADVPRAAGAAEVPLRFIDGCEGVAAIGHA